MNMDRQDRLKALGLWPVWRLRAAAMAEPEAASPDDAEPAVMAQITLPPAPAMPPSPVPSPLPDLDWDALGAAVKACDRCPLARSRTQGVPGVGDPNAEWLFIGEAPGADEDRQGEPFVGQAGKLLDAMMAGIGLRRGRNVYIANILKSRPPGNRDPRPEEVEACLPYLERQIDLIIRLRLQHLSDRRRSDQVGLVRGAQPVPAARRPGPQSGRHGAGLRQSRKGGPDPGDAGAGAGWIDSGDAGTGQ
jgi:hypothetical protein